MLLHQCETVRSMKIRDVLRDKSFRLMACFYVFLGIAVFHLKAFATSPKVEYGLNVPKKHQWYSEPWIWAVLTAVLILLVALNGRVKDPEGVRKRA